MTMSETTEATRERIAMRLKEAGEDLDRMTMQMASLMEMVEPGATGLPLDIYFSLDVVDLVVGSLRASRRDLDSLLRLWISGEPHSKAVRIGGGD
jgi:transcriptional regulator of aromatic amino acid metabolism